MVPPQYWNGIPDELQQRLNRLTNERDVVEEMQVFAIEEINQGRYPLPNRSPNPTFSPPTQPYGQPPIPQSNPIERGNLMPDVPHSGASDRQRIIDQRRRLLTESTLPMPPLRIEIIPATVQN
jgi:hypothetical protein